MINFRSTNYYIIVLIILAFVFGLCAILGVQLLDVASYSALFLGISIFYSSYLKQYQAGIIFGAVLFLTGSIFYVTSHYEILNLGNVFVPLLLVIFGTSLLLGNILTKINFIAVLFSTLSLIAGVWLMIARGNTTVYLFLSAAYVIFKSYGIIIIVSAAGLFLISKSFKKKDIDQN